MAKDDCIIIITGKHPIKAKKAYQYLLFPNVTNSFYVSQLNYQNNPSQEVLEGFEEKKEEYKKYIYSNDRKVSLQRAEVELHENQVKNAEKEAEMQEKLAMSFFSQMNSTPSENPPKEGSTLN